MLLDVMCCDLKSGCIGPRAQMSTSKKHFPVGPNFSGVKLPWNRWIGCSYMEWLVELSGNFGSANNVASPATVVSHLSFKLHLTITKC